MKCYHFTSNKLRNGDPIPPIGEWLEYTGKIVPCESGLHASEHPLDALQYAPGNLLHVVELEGDLVSHGNPIDKWVGRRRKIIATINAESLLREFARWCASQVLHLWDAPQIVKEYLASGDESLRGAAWGAAWGAAMDAARGAARDAAMDAAMDAAWGAARDAAWGAARGAARGAAWDAAWGAQRTKFSEMVKAALAAGGEG